MALIKCDECGQMVSDKAEVCPNCGGPIEAPIVCKECGAELKSTDLACPKCGCPVNNTGASKTAESQPKEKIAFSEEREKDVQQFLLRNRKFLPQERIKPMRSQLLALSESQWSNVEFLTFKDPTTMLLISIFIGALGIDRFMLGETVSGILKLVLTLCCGVGLIWWLIDLFLINQKTIDYNYQQLEETIKYA